MVRSLSFSPVDALVFRKPPHWLYGPSTNCSITVGGISSRMPAFFSLTLLSRSMTNRSTGFLTLKAPITTAADDIHKYFFNFSEKIRLDASSESSARQRIQLKHQALFCSKDKGKKLKCRLLQFLFGALRVKIYF